MALDADIRARLDRALAGASSWYDLHSRFRAEVPDGEEERHRALVWAFGYDLVSPSDPERRVREGSPFGAMFEFSEGRMPPRLADVPETDVAVWANAFEEVSDPRLRSRIGDLLWSRKAKPDPDVKARAACEALIALSRLDGWGPMETTDGLVRASELALELADDTLTLAVADRSREVIVHELDHHDDRPGITFNLLRVLVDLRPALRPDDLSALVGNAEGIYGADPHHVESAIDLQVILSDSASERTALRRRQAELWREAARKAQGILRAAFLEKALDVARTHGLAELARELRVELQGITEDELDLKTVSADVTIERDKTERFHKAFVQFDSWQQSLRAFGAYGPPGGEPDEVERQVEQQMKDHPIQYLVSKVVFDPDFGAPIFHAVDDASHKLAAVAQSRWMASQFWALSAVSVLELFVNRYGRPSREDLTAHFTTDLIDAAAAERIARAYELWWDDRPDESAHLIVPRLEAAIRNLAREVGLPIIKEPYGGEPGGVRPLGTLLHALRGRFASLGWHAYLYHLLSDPLGLNLRNVIAHGVRARIERADAALLLHAAAFLALLEVQRRPANSAE